MTLAACGAIAMTACNDFLDTTPKGMVIPTTVAAVRAGAGSSAPFDILPAVWLASALSVAAGLLSAALLSRLGRRGGR